MSNNNLDKNIKSKLLEYQIEHTNNLIRILTNNNTCLDASDTGTGKTYSAVAVCAHLQLIPIIVCPKSIISNWRRICIDFNVKKF